jgi:hypothetical protein
MPELSSKLSKNIKWPIYDTLEAFEASGGSKLKKMVQLVTYHRANPDAPQVLEWSDTKNDVVWPAYTAVNQEASRQAPKFLVYFFFAAMSKTIVSVHNLLYFELPLCSSVLYTGFPCKRHQGGVHHRQYECKDTLRLRRKVENNRGYPGPCIYERRCDRHEPHERKDRDTPSALIAIQNTVCEC